jgi:hypothetical protein
MKTYSTKSLWLAALAAISAMAVSYTAHAASITFTYDRTITSGPTLTPGGPFGTLTLTDSVVDPNRVDMDVVLNALNVDASVNGLNNFFVNYSGSFSSATQDFKLVLQTDPTGTFNGTAGSGTVNLNNQGPFGTTVDILLDPAGSTPSMTFSASLVLRLNATGHAESNLDVSMFDLKDANNLLYSAFNTLPANHTFNYGATTDTTNGVPDGGSTLILLSFGLLGLARLARRIR